MRKLWAAGLAVVFVLLAVAVGWTARAQVLIPKAEDVRFELLSNEPIATPDGRSVVAGYSVLIFKDRRTGQCYIAFTGGSAMGGVAPAPCSR